MNKILKLKQTKSFKESGFITLEILVSIFIASAFLAVSMQSLVYAMAFKVQAQEKNRANELITEQLERTNELANRSNLAGVCDPPDPNPNNAYLQGYGNGLWTALAVNNLTPPTKSLLSDGGGKTVALEATEVSAIAGNSNAPHRSLRVRYQVWEWGVDPANPGVSNFLDTDGTIRTLPNPGTNTAGDQPIAETYVEIIPDVALACP